MQITEQLIERIARRVFNSMFAPALRQSNVQGGGTSGSVRYADEAGHAASADTADSANTAAAVPWTGVSDKPATATRWPTWSEVTSKPNSFTPSAHTHAWGDITSGVPSTATRWPSWSEVTSKPANKSAWGRTYLNGSSEFQNVSGDLSAGSSGGTISQFHSIELNSAGSLSGYGGFIDFHFNGSTSDYTSRIIEDASGKLNLNQAVFVNYNGNVGIGDSNPAYKLEVAGTCRISSSLSIATTSTSYALNVGGTIYATGSITERSDIRCKDVETYQWSPTLDMIADAPIIRYTMKDDKTHRMRVGSVAQYWEKMMPETVSKDNEGILSIAQGDICMVSVIALAREVRKLREEVIQLKNGRN